MFKNFDNKVYWKYFVPVTLSMIGVGFFVYTQGWYILDLTGSKLSVGLTWSIFFTPSLFFLPIMGKLLDAPQFKKVLVIFEFSKALILLCFVLLLVFIPNKYLVYLMSALFGIVFAIFIPSIYVVLKKIVNQEEVSKYSHLLEVSFQIASSSSILIAGLLYNELGFFVLAASGGILIAIAGFIISHLNIGTNDNSSNGFNLLGEYKKFFITAKEILCAKHKEKKAYWFGIMHQFSQNIVLTLNIPILLYVYETMKKGPPEYGVIDSLMGFVALGTGIFWTRYYQRSQDRRFVLIMPLIATIILCGIYFINPNGIMPYIIFATLSIFLTSSKIQCRAAVVKKTPAEVMGKFGSFYQITSYIIMLCLAFITSYLCQHLAVQTVFLFLGIFMLGFSLFLVSVYEK